MNKKSIEKTYRKYIDCLIDLHNDGYQLSKLDFEKILKIIDNGLIKKGFSPYYRHHIKSFNCEKYDGDFTIDFNS